LKNYYRDLLVSQTNHIELCLEKNTLLGIIKPVAMEYRMPCSSGRGYASLPLRHDLVQRYRNSGKERLILLVVSDHDPEGNDIPHALARSIRDDFCVEKVDAIKVALTAEQVEDMDLPPIIEAKRTSSRYSGFVEKHGRYAHELEAIPPNRMQEIVRDAIDSVLDIDAFNHEVGAEKKDAARLMGTRAAMMAQFDNLDLDNLN
jgi:hypothetical protein